MVEAVDYEEQKLPEDLNLEFVEIMLKHIGLPSCGVLEDGILKVQKCVNTGFLTLSELDNVIVKVFEELYGQEAVSHLFDRNNNQESPQFVINMRVQLSLDGDSLNRSLSWTNHAQATEDDDMRPAWASKFKSGK